MVGRSCELGRGRYSALPRFGPANGPGPPRKRLSLGRAAPTTRSAWPSDAGMAYRTLPAQPTPRRRLDRGVDRNGVSGWRSDPPLTP